MKESGLKLFQAALHVQSQEQSTNVRWARVCTAVLQPILLIRQTLEAMRVVRPDRHWPSIGIRTVEQLQQLVQQRSTRHSIGEALPKMSIQYRDLRRQKNSYHLPSASLLSSVFVSFSLVPGWAYSQRISSSSSSLFFSVLFDPSFWHFNSHLLLLYSPLFLLLFRFLPIPSLPHSSSSSSLSFVYLVSCLLTLLVLFLLFFVFSLLLSPSIKEIKRFLKASYCNWVSSDLLLHRLYCRSAFVVVTLQE